MQGQKCRGKNAGAKKCRATAEKCRAKNLQSKGGKNAEQKRSGKKNAEQKCRGKKMQRQKVQSEKVEQTSESDLPVACCLLLVVL